MELDASDDSQPLGEHAIEANDLVPWTASNGGHVGYFSNAPQKKDPEIKVVVSSKKSPFFSFFFWGVVVAGINCETEPMCCSLELDGAVDLYIESFF